MEEQHGSSKIDVRYCTLLTSRNENADVGHKREGHRDHTGSNRPPSLHTFYTPPPIEWQKCVTNSWLMPHSQKLLTQNAVTFEPTQQSFLPFYFWHPETNTSFLHCRKVVFLWHARIIIIPRPSQTVGRQKWECNYYSWERTAAQLYNPINGLICAIVSNVRMGTDSVDGLRYQWVHQLAGLLLPLRNRRCRRWVFSCFECLLDPTEFCLLEADWSLFQHTESWSI